MYNEKLILGVAPTKRSFLSMEEACRQKKSFMNVIRSIKSDHVGLVDIDDLCENGIVYDYEGAKKVIKKFKSARIDALFIPFCDFGEETVVAKIAKEFMLPTLIWGNRDERPNTDAQRGRDTQCGMFAATKVLARYGVKYSYIFNCETDSEEFSKGYENFIRTAAVITSLKGLRIAKIGQRPETFMSVMTNEAALLQRFGITVVPVSPFEIVRKMDQVIAGNEETFLAYYKDLTSRMSSAQMEKEQMQKVAAMKIAIEQTLKEKDCSVGAFECWSAFPKMIGLCPCTVLGELTDIGMPLACETDINGAISLAILRACNLFEESEFLADLTIRHPQNDNAELLWHCGPFPYSLKDEKSQAKIVDGQERFMLKQGDLTVCRFDDLNGEYYLFSGEAKTTEGPKTNGTYVWMETDDWKRWEEKLMFGPYIHHLGCTYGHYLPVLREAARYLDIHFDDAQEQGIYSL